MLVTEPVECLICGKLISNLDWYVWFSAYNNYYHALCFASNQNFRRSMELKKKENDNAKY